MVAAFYKILRARRAEKKTKITQKVSGGREQIVKTCAFRRETVNAVKWCGESTDWEEVYLTRFNK